MSSEPVPAPDKLPYVQALMDVLRRVEPRVQLVNWVITVRDDGSERWRPEQEQTPPLYQRMRCEIMANVSTTSGNKKAALVRPDGSMRITSVAEINNTSGTLVDFLLGLRYSGALAMAGHQWTVQSTISSYADHSMYQITCDTLINDRTFDPHEYPSDAGNALPPIGGTH